jgi:hypothetical protein
MAKSKGSKEFEPSAYAAPGGPSSKELGQTDMGASRIDYGEQRYGVGVSGEESRDYAEPGDEGSIAVGLQVGNGGIGSHQSFDSPMSGTPTGE